MVLPEVALLELSSAITILQRKFGYVSLHVEGTGPGMCFIGEYLDLDDDFVLLHQFGPLKRMDRSELLLRLEHGHARGRGG